MDGLEQRIIDVDCWVVARIGFRSCLMPMLAGLLLSESLKFLSKLRWIMSNWAGRLRRNGNICHRGTIMLG